MIHTIRIFIYTYNCFIIVHIHILYIYIHLYAIDITVDLHFIYTISLIKTMTMTFWTVHYSDVIMGVVVIKSPASRLFSQLMTSSWNMQLTPQRSMVHLPSYSRSRYPRALTFNGGCVSLSRIHWLWIEREIWSTWKGKKRNKMLQATELHWIHT